jgi:hypothetical protein
MTGRCLCLVKGVRETEPFARVWVECEQVSPTKWNFKRPRMYKRGVGGVHYKLLPETYEAFSS